MQLTLSIVSLFFVVSALGNPVTSDTTVVELDPRQSCDVGKCLSTIGTETGGIISACGTAAGDLERIGAAILQNKPPAQADITALASDTIKCVFQSVSAGFAIPGACLSCVT